MFFTVTEIVLDEDDVVSERQLAINPLHVTRFYPMEEDGADHTGIEIHGDGDVTVVTQSWNEVWSRIKEVIG